MTSYWFRKQNELTIILSQSRKRNNTCKILFWGYPKQKTDPEKKHTEVRQPWPEICSLGSSRQIPCGAFRKRHREHPRCTMQHFDICPLPNKIEPKPESPEIKFDKSSHPKADFVLKNDLFSVRTTCMLTESWHYFRIEIMIIPWAYTRQLRSHLIL